MPISLGGIMRMPQTFHCFSIARCLSVYVSGAWGGKLGGLSRMNLYRRFMSGRIDDDAAVVSLTRDSEGHRPAGRRPQMADVGWGNKDDSPKMMGTSPLGRV